MQALIEARKGKLFLREMAGEPDVSGVVFESREMCTQYCLLYLLSKCSGPTEIDKKSREIKSHGRGIDAAGCLLVGEKYEIRAG